jgi:hypothetical protein
MPHSDEDHEQTKAYKLFQVVKANVFGITKPRSLTQLRTYWAVCGVVSELVSDEHNTFDKDDIDFEIKIQAAKKKPALIKRYKMVSGIVYMEHISISFENMKHLEACKFFDIAYPILGDMVGMEVDALIALAKSKMGR